MLCCAVLVGCGAQIIPHKALSAPWQAKETAVYTVERSFKDEDKEHVMGEQTMITENLENRDITVGTKTIEGFSGTLVTIETVMDDGSTMSAAVAFNANFHPVAAYKKVFVKGYEGESPSSDLTQELNAVYSDSDKRYDFTAVDKGETIEDSVKLKDKWLKSPYFDNLMIYHIARSSYSSNAFLPFSYTVPSWSKRALIKLSAAQLTDKITINTMGVDVECSQITITLNQSFPGSGQPLVVCLADSAIGEGKLNVRALVRYTEGDMRYTLKSLEF